MHETRLGRGAALGLMVGVLLLAAVLYLDDITHVSFWEDESWMAVAIDGSLPRVWTFSTEHGVHPPLYFYLGWFFVRLVGYSELALRWLAGLCALVGVAGTYRLGAEWFGRRAGVFAGALIAGSLFLVYFGRLARHYTLFFALAVLLVWAYERWRRRPDYRGWWAALVLLQAGLLYTHYFGAWMALVLGLHGLLTLPRREKIRLGLGLTLSGLLFLPWVPSALQQRGDYQTGLGYAFRATRPALTAYLDQVVNGSYWFGGALGVLGIVAVIRWRRWQTGVLLGLWLVVPLVLSLAFNTRFAWFVERNMIFTLGGVMILFGAGLAWLSATRPGLILAAVVALSFVGRGIYYYDDFWPFKTPHWREMVQATAWDARPDDLFMVSGEPYSLTYYLHRLVGKRANVIGLEEWLAYTSQEEDRIWLTGSGGAVLFEAIDALPPGMVQTRRYALGTVVTEFYQRPPDQPRAVFGDQLAVGVIDSGLPPTVASGSTIYLDLWWRPVSPPELDYSVGVFLLDPEGRPVSQQDGGFDRGRIPAYALPDDRWTPDARALPVPDSASPGRYEIGLVVYDWRDGTRLIPDTGREDGVYIVGNVQVTR